MLIYWFFNVTKDDLQLRTVFKWLVYPVTYIIFIIVRGYLSGYYPYPFLNIKEIGFEKTMMNITIIIALAITIFVVLSSIGNYIVKIQRKK